MEFEELSKFLKSGKVVGPNHSATSLDLSDQPAPYENFRNSIYQYPSSIHRSWTDYPGGTGISKRRRPVPGVSRLVQSVRKFRKDSSSRLVKQYDEILSSEEDVSDSDRNYKLSSMDENAPSSSSIPMAGPAKDQYQQLPKVRYSRSSSKSSFIATPSAETREEHLYRPDRLRGFRSKSHNSIKDGLPPRTWRRKHTRSPKNPASALGIEFNDGMLTDKEGNFEEPSDQYESMVNIKAAVSNMSEPWGHHATSMPSTKEEMADKLSSEYLVNELIRNISYLQGKVKLEEEKISSSKAEMKSYIDSLRALDDNVEKLNARIAAARLTAIPNMEQQLSETGQRNPSLKRSRNAHIKTVKSIDQQNRRMKDYPTKLSELERRIQAARRREAASMLMDKWGWPIVVVMLSVLLAFVFNS